MKKHIICFGVLALVSTAWAQESPNPYQEAYRLYQAKDYARAEGVLRPALQADPHNPADHQLMGNILYAQGRADEAMAEYQLSLDAQPDNPNLRAFVEAHRHKAAPPAETPGGAGRAPRDPSEKDKPCAILGLFGGPAFWGGMANNNSGGETFSTGWGGGLYVGCQFDRHFSVTLNFSENNLPYNYGEEGILGSTGVNYALQEWQLTTVCRYLMGDGGVRPYIRVGMGALLTISTESYEGYSSNYATTAPVFQFGLGVFVPLSREWDAFLGADYDLAFYIPDNEDQTYSFFPVNLGVQYNLL